MVQYRRPRDVGEALQVLADANGSGRVLVGGTDLLVGVRRRPLEPLVLVDIKAAVDLPPAIEVTSEAMRFGPTATMSSIGADARAIEWFPALAASSRVVGSVAIRNRATLIGNICNASPAADTAPALLVYGASVTIAGPAGERTMPLSAFFLGPGSTACGPDELVVRVDVPIPSRGHRSAFERLTRRRGVDLATVNAAAGVSTDGVVTLGLGAVGPTPLVSGPSSPIDVSSPPAVADVVEQLITVATPISDVRAGEPYRRAMTAVLARRAIQRAVEVAS
ncbi:MAG: FAD binding domain-containing protein [Actinomycetota bacterium]